MTKPVGFDQKVLLHHLDYTANHTKKYSRQEMYDVLDGYLRNDITGAKSRKNAITMLMKIWYLVNEDIAIMRNRLLDILPDLTKEERILVHWGMTLAAYPFFKDVAQEFGKLFKLQDEVQSMVIGKRMKEAYGDRRRVEVATSAVLMSMKAWGLIDVGKSRSYRVKEKIEISNPEMQSFIIHILLYVLDHKALQLDVIQNHILFFPFSYEFNLMELRKNPDFVFHRQGVDTIVVERNID
ncbi:hypothetical protein AB1283_12335 [Bacillus sp. S13(2024)]|uniref:hypothetical protein n=1 Tax=unclassified Bacillus (in: firmicutes) TaxID=185979 RepID=UPI003D1E218F